MSTRRDFLVGAAGITATVIPAAATAAEHPDATLLTDCQAFDTLERAYHATCEYEDDDPRKEAEQSRAVDEQQPFLDRICGTPARTMEGLQAKARSLCLWDEFAIMDDAEYTDDRIRSSLLRDILGADLPKIKPMQSVSDRGANPDDLLATGGA